MPFNPNRCAEQARCLSAALAAAASLLLAACGAVMADPRFGVADLASADLIGRANERAALRTAGRYADLASALEADLARLSADAYASSRLRNELAELYSHQILDIERAVKLDEALSAAEIPATDLRHALVPAADVASQRILADPRYGANYLRIDAETLRARSAQRLRVNRALLNGQAPAPTRGYDAAFLTRHLATVVADLPSTHAATPERRTLQSRRVRAELELLRVQPATTLLAYEPFLQGELTPQSTDLAEIDFLSLSEYLLQAARASGRIELAEMALEVVYRPYSRIQDSGARWRYNRIVNDTIAALAEDNFKAGRFEEMLYYLSLNKSRLLLEERLALSARGRRTDSLAVAAADDGIPRTPAGLPQKAWFRQQLASTPAFIDFYLAGRSVAMASPAGKSASLTNTSTGQLRTRDFGLEETSASNLSFVDTTLYVTRVDNGRIAAAWRLREDEVERLRLGTESLYAAVSSPRLKAALTLDPLFARLRREARAGSTPVVSPDKWLSKLPFDALLDRATTRAVNIFMTAPPGELGRLQVTGFFNPTLDLPGAEREAEAITKAIPGARTLKREAATLAALSNAREANIVHLSMHGSFDARDPRDSKLYFAGARNDRTRNSADAVDPAALYARDMASNPALQRKDLVFAAACQTGLSAATGANDAELLGILRPLTAAGNRHVILSLWNVDDEATQAFVSSFYEHLSRTRQVPQAFQAAQADLRKRYPAPYYWAAFYLAQSR